MWNIYHLIYVNTFRLFSFTEDLRGGKGAKMKTLLFLSFFGGLNFLALAHILKKYNIINVYVFIDSNLILSLILILVIMYFIHFLTFSNFKNELLIQRKLESSSHFRLFSYAITFGYFLLSIVFMGISR